MKKFDLHLLWLLFLTIVTAFLWSEILKANDARVLRLDDKKVGRVFVSFGKSTILSFPSKPTKVVLGNKGAFALEYIDNDLALASLLPQAHSNLFVYLQGRRFAFDLISSTKNSDEIVIVKDIADKTINARVRKISG